MEILLTGMIWLIVFALGSAIGSFLNVVIYRIPAGLSIVHPPSRCPQCLHRLGKSENMPIIGWLRLGGKCRHCGVKISPRYPLVEASMGIIFLLVFQYFGISLETLGYWAFLSWLLALALIDLDTMTLPNALTKSGLLVGLGFQLGWGFQAQGAIPQLMTGIQGAVVGIWLFEAIALAASIALGQQAMGSGDSKLAAMMGAWLGWKYLLVGSFLACALGAFLGGGAIALGWIDRRQPIPFGPFLALGAALSVFMGKWLLQSYWQLFFPLGYSFPFSNYL